MTNEECISIIRNAEGIRMKEERLAREKAIKTKQEALDKWANDNARFKVGDIITYPNSENIMRVDSIKGDQYLYRRHLDGGLFVVYCGTLLTKKLEPRKNASQFSMYDDGRGIVKVK